MNEVWKAVPGYEGSYEVSNQGRFRSLDRLGITRRGFERKYKGKIMKTNSSTGKTTIHLSNSTEQKLFNVGELVYTTFVGEITPGQLLTHRNGDITDCSVENITLMSVEESKIASKRMKNTQGVLSDNQVKDIRRLHAENKTPHEIANALNIKYVAVVVNVVKGETYSWVA